MFERIGTSIGKSGNSKVRAITVRIKIKSSKGPWRIADIQLQEGSVVTEYVEHVAEMERIGG